MKLEVAVKGETLTLLADKALLWRDLLVIADAHFGKGAVFRGAGIPVPAGTTEADLARIDALLDATRARRLLFLGDFTHAGGRLDPKARERLLRWRKKRADLSVSLVIGNHDRGIAPVAAALEMTLFNELAEGPFVFRHDPPATPLDRYAVTGHLHPAVRLEGEAGRRLRAPCFWLSPRFAVLPAFGGFTGLYDVAPGPRDGVAVVGEGQIALIRPPRF